MQAVLNPKSKTYELEVIDQIEEKIRKQPYKTVRNFIDLNSTMYSSHEKHFIMFVWSNQVA